MRFVEMLSEWVKGFPYRVFDALTLVVVTALVTTLGAVVWDPVSKGDLIEWMGGVKQEKYEELILCVRETDRDRKKGCSMDLLRRYFNHK